MHYKLFQLSRILLSRACIIIVPPVCEGLRLIVTEANAIGTPEIGQDVNGVRDSIRHIQTGIIIKDHLQRQLTGNLAASTQFTKHRRILCITIVTAWQEDSVVSLETSSEQSNLLCYFSCSYSFSTFNSIVTIIHVRRSKAQREYFILLLVHTQTMLAPKLVLAHNQIFI